MAAAVAVCASLLLGAPEARAQPKVRTEGAISALSYASGGKWLAVGYSDDAGAGRVRVYSAKSRKPKPIDLPALAKPIASVAFVDQDRYLAAADAGSEVVVWSWPERIEVFRVNLGKKQGQPGSRFHLLGNPQGPHIAWIEMPAGGAHGVVEVVEVPRGNVVTSITMVKIDHQAAWSRDGTFLLLAGAVWSWDTLQSWKPQAAGVTAVSDDGTKAASASPNKCDGIAIVDLSGKKVLRTVEVKRSRCPAFLWFIADGRALAWLGEVNKGDGERSFTLFRWDAVRDRVRTVKKGLPTTNVVVISPNGRTVAAADGNRVRFVKLR